MTLDLENAFLLWQATLASNTRRAYAADLRDLAKFLGEPSPLEAIRELTSNGAGRAYAILQAWRAELAESGRAASTRNRRLAAVNSILKFLSATAVLDWSIRIRPERLSNDLRRKLLPLHKLAAMMALAKPRDRAMLWLLYCPSLRVSEAVGLDVADVDLVNRLVWFRGKARVENESHDLAPQAAAAIEAWLQVRGTKPGPLLRTWGRRRLTSRHAYQIVRELAAKVGVPGIGPHALRHLGITEATKALKGNMPLLLEYSRHSSMDVAARYVHLVQNTRGRTVGLVADALADAVEAKAVGQLAEDGANEGMLAGRDA